jgi:maltooligosyltrehalose trehalohydrolase
MPLDNDRTRFRVWAPRAQHVEVVLVDQARSVCVPPQQNGYYEAIVENCPVGTRYKYRLDRDLQWPDPASRLQPDGVHGPSEIVPASFDWSDKAWRGLELTRYVIYELHVGTFTEAGTFEALIDRIPYFQELGVNAIELMPVAQFPGERNWGYDGTYPYAAQNSYGGPDGLRRFVDAAHRSGLAVILDVVYNHLGPEGNYLSLFGPYFTDTYKTPWGSSLNYDGDWSDEVRRFFIGNALYWIEDCHIDALRLDAVHAIVDTSAQPFLQDLAREVQSAARRLGRHIHLVAENDRNDPNFARPISAGGIGMDAQWSDDFHHALHTVLTGEKHGYYSDFGQLTQLARAYEDGFVYAGEYSEHRHRKHGAPADDLGPHQFVICAQNHDQVGNRMLGDRFSGLLSFEKQKLAAAALLLAPNVPLLFMGEEYGEPSPFLYFVSHGDNDLIEAVRNGRRQEFAAFQTQGVAPDPQAEETFERSRVHLELRTEGKHARLFAWYRELLRLRKLPALATAVERTARAIADEQKQILVLVRAPLTGAGSGSVAALFNFSDQVATISVPAGAPGWHVLLSSRDPRFGGPGDTQWTAPIRTGSTVTLPGNTVVVLEPA